MYGDCQVLSSIGGNAIPSDDSLYTSPSLQNPNFNFNPFDIFNPIIPKEEIGMAKSKEEMDSGSGSEHNGGGGGMTEQEGEGEDNPPPAKKKRYHRHTARQIQEMEALFKECPHPDDKQRLRLSQELDLKPRQVKFWFQNRRTQMKAQQDRQDNVVLRAENDNLKKENYRLQAALRNVVCPNCGGPAILGEMGFDEHTLRIENARLKEELDRVCCLLAQYNGRPMQELSPSQLLDSSLELDMSNVYPRKFEENMMNQFVGEGSSSAAGSYLIMEEEKSLALQLAVSSADELVKMSQMADPLWIQADLGRSQVLNVEEYNRVFTNGLSDAARFRTEGTKDSAVVIMNSITLVEAFMDANKWMELFPSIISRAKTLQVVHPGVSGQAIGCLLLMYAEIQVLSPLVATREFHFLRYCQHNADQGSWTIVDFPVDGFHNFCPPPLPYCRRHPSGCVIQDMPNGYSTLTWIEHSEVDNAPIHHVFDHLVTSGTAFGACRWLAALQSQCERLASVMARNISDLGVIPSPEARTNLMNLAQRMVRTFCLNISTCYGQSWTAIPDSAEDTIRITTRKVAETDLGQPNGLILSAVSSTWLPYDHKQVFDFLRDERRRVQLEVLSNGNSLHEVAHIANGSHPGNCISLLRINVASNSSQTVELVLQESCSDDSGSMVVYATINVDALQLAMNGQDPSSISLLPLGFVLVPMQQPTTGATGCLLTVGLQVLVSTMASAKINLSSVTAINHHLCTTVEQINAALGNCDDKGDNDTNEDS